MLTANAMLPIIPNLAAVLKLHMTSPFGVREDPVTHVKGSFHTGVDLGIISYTPISAPWDWEVMECAENDVEGIHVVLYHPEVKRKTGYCHLIKYNVAVGQKGKAGEIVCLTGNTGKCTKNAAGVKLAHLHFTVLEPNEKGAFHFVDPLPYLWSAVAEAVPEKIEQIPLNTEYQK